MATGYNKQSTYVDGNVITASLFNEDFGALQNAFAYTTDPSTTGHTHDGSAHQGGAISKIGDVDFNNKIEIDGTNNAIKLFIEVGGTTATEILTLTASALSPSVASIDLGASSQPFDSAYINSITMPDSDGTTNRINLGTATDFNIHYNANNTAVLQSTTASSVIDVDGKAGVKLKTDGTERLATTSTGVNVSGAFTVDTDVLVVDDTNNRVGIGTTSPSDKLHVSTGTDIDAGNIAFTIGGSSTSNGRTASIVKNTSTPYELTIQAGNHATSNMETIFKSSDSQETMRIDASGNVGIGTDLPLDLLHINSDTTDARLLLDGHTNFDAELKFAENGSVKYTVGHDAATDSFRIGTTNVDTNPRLVIDSSGNVGIGTTSPSAILQVESYGIETTSTDTSAVTQVGITTFKKAEFRSAKFMVQATNTTDSTYMIAEILLIHDGTTPSITEYGIIFTGSAREATFDADISGDDVRLLATPGSTDDITFRVVSHQILV